MADLKHEAVSRLKRIACELGRVPKRDEARALGLNTKLCESFGTFGELLKNSGLEKEQDEGSSKKRVKEFFSRDIRELNKPLKEFAPFDMPKFTKTVILGDMHLPFVSNEALMSAYSFLDSNKVQTIIQCGDIYDFYSFSKFPRSHLIINPDEEVKLARKMAEEFWKSVRRLQPNARLIQILGNHDIRPHKRILESGAPELEAFFNFKPLFEFDGVETIHDTRKPFVQNNISFIHGFQGAGTHRAKLQTHVVHGHLHKGGLVYSKDPRTNKFLFELDCGYLGDPFSKVFNYTPVREKNWSHGLGFISEYGPHWVPFRE